MAAAAQARGYEYIALTDHNRHVAMAHGLDPARLLRQIREVDQLNAKSRGLTILKGIEVDTLKDGRLDLPDPSLSQLTSWWRPRTRISICRAGNRPIASRAPRKIVTSPSLLIRPGG
jgi:hypothetical protein